MSAPAVTAPDEVLTPTVGRAGRKALPWLVGVALVVIVALAIVAARAGAGDGGVPYAADNPGPTGSMALVEVLRQQGVRVVVADSLTAAEDAVDASGDTTLLFSDPDRILDSSQRTRLARLDADLVLVEPDYVELQDVGVDIALAGDVDDGTIAADCDVTAVEKAGSVTSAGRSYRTDAATASTCLAVPGDGDPRFGLVQIDQGRRTVTALGLGAALTNGRIATDGNAALALNLLGAQPTLVWYLPTSDDLRETTPPTLAELTPGWVTPLVVLLALVGIGAAVWRGRRMGPLVIENLPVVVRASETMEGRARLYERGNARLHALDALRIGAVERLAGIAGLARTSSVAEVVDATAALTGRDRAAIAAILLDAAPVTDADLVRMSDDLLTLEDDAARAARAR